MASYPEVGVNFAMYELVRDIIRKMPKKEWNIAKDKCLHCILNDSLDYQKDICMKHVHELVRQLMVTQLMDDLEMKAWVNYCLKLSLCCVW